METVMQEIIKKFEDAQKHIISENEYANGYNGALSDCIDVIKSFLEKEKQQIIDAIKYANNEPLMVDSEMLGNAYYENNFKSK